MKRDVLKDSTQPGSWDRLWSDRHELAPWDYLSHIIFSHVAQRCPAEKSDFVLEAGSGSGRISARLLDHGHRVCQMDNSIKSLRFNQKRWGCRSPLFAGDLRAMPFRDGVFRVVWSSGVLEHFRGGDLAGILIELGRTVKSGGLLISLVPYAHCAPYRVAKWILEKTSLWAYGREEPLRTLRNPSEQGGLEVVSEYTIAFSALGIQNAQYIPGIRPVGRWLGRLACRLYDSGLLRWYDQWSSRIFGGYLLVSIARKR